MNFPCSELICNAKLFYSIIFDSIRLDFNAATIYTKNSAKIFVLFVLFLFALQQLNSFILITELQNILFLSY